MEEKKISDKKEVENDFIEISAEKKQTVLLPSYTKSCSQTRIESIIFEFTWEIDQFLNLSKCIDTLCSPLFPETAEYKIQMNVLRKKDSQSIETTQFYLLATKAFTGLCSTTIMFPRENIFSSNSISCRTSNSILLIEIDHYESRNRLYNAGYSNRLKIDCKFEFFYKLTSNTTYMNLQPSLEDSTLDKSHNKLEDEKSINFIVENEKYVISKKLLHSTNSCCFKNICFTHGKEIDMTNELTASELPAFKEMLVFITTGSIKSNGYNMLTKLLTTADKYDVPNLKLTCEYYLLRKITVCNAVELIQLAFEHDAEFLKINSASFIKFYFKEVVNTDEFKNLPQESSNKILELIEKCKVPEISTDQFL